MIIGIRTIRMALAVALTVAMAFGASAAFAASGEATQRQMPPPKAKQNTAETEIYSHPVRNFSFPIPPGSELIERDDDPHPSIRSRRGYMISIQSGAARPHIPLTAMPSLLESQYFGPGKPWTIRGESRSLKIAGLPAHEVVYAGANTRARVVVARGARNDFVFIFFASHRKFQTLVAEFDWVLENFKPDEADLIVAEKEKPLKKQPVAFYAQRFSEPGYGYSMDYPADWVLSKQSMVTTMFSGREGTPGYAAVVSVQNVKPPSATTSIEAAATALNDLRNSLERLADDISYEMDQPWTYQHGTLGLEGRQLVVSYIHAGERFQKQVIVVPRPSGQVAHVWTFTAPKQEFTNFQPTALRMLESWMIKTSGG